jgi:hypothetical protein
VIERRGTPFSHIPLPIERDRLMMALVAFNMAFTCFDVFLAHSASVVETFFMHIPRYYFVFGVVPPAWLALTNTRKTWILWVHLLCMAGGIMVGVVGFAFHLRTVMLPSGQFVWDWLIFSAPVLAPLAFAGIATMGITAALHETVPGHFDLPGLRDIPIGLTKRQLYFIFIGLGLAAATLTAAVEHSQEGYLNWTMWLPAVAGGIATGAFLGHAAKRRPQSGELFAVLGASALSTAIGLLGFAFHASFDAGAAGTISIERMVHGAPLFAPLLFADLAFLALIAAGRKVGPAPAEIEAAPAQP